jgi:hypothetical protein
VGDREERAFLGDCFPCNARPFINRMAEILKENTCNNYPSLPAEANDNPLFKTGILMPREELGRMKSLLQNKYKLETDNDLMALVTEKGQSLVEEIMEAAHA